MLIGKKTGFVGLGALGLSLVFALQAPVAWGQTATDLVCVGCVQGTDIQDGTIGPNKLIPGSINATTIANGVIGPNKLIPGSINTTTIATDAIRSNKILDGAVQSVDIQDGGVTSVDIQNNTITQSDIATNGVGAAEIATNAVGQSEIATSGVASAEVLDNSLTQNDLATNSVGAAEIAANAVGQSEIATSGVASSEVQNNTLLDIDMVDEAGADFSDGNNSVTLPAGATVIRTVSITKPTGGVVIVNTSGHFSFISTGADGARCSISEGTTVDFSHLIIGNDFGSTAGSNDFMPFASTRGFQINTAGTSTFRLVCEEFEGNVRIDDGSLNAIFVPTRY